MSCIDALRARLEHFESDGDGVGPAAFYQSLTMASRRGICRELAEGERAEVDAFMEDAFERVRAPGAEAAAPIASAASSDGKTSNGAATAPGTRLTIGLSGRSDLDARHTAGADLALSHLTLLDAGDSLAFNASLSLTPALDGSTLRTGGRLGLSIVDMLASGTYTLALRAGANFSLSFDDNISIGAPDTLTPNGTISVGLDYGVPSANGFMLSVDGDISAGARVSSDGAVDDFASGNLRLSAGVRL